MALSPPEVTLKSTTGGPSSYLMSLCRVPFFRRKEDFLFNNGIMTNLYASSFASCSFARMPLVDDSIGPTNHLNFKSRAIPMCQRQRYFSDLMENHSPPSQESRNSFPNPVPRAALSSNLSLQLNKLRGLAFLCTHFSCSMGY